MGPANVVSVWCLCLCLLSPPGDILLIVADCQAGQPSLSCCTLKCKITISEIENGWLSTVAAPAVPCCRRVGDGWGSAAAGSDQAGATGGWAGLWREEMPGAGSSIHLVDLQMGGRSSSSSPDGWSVAISILAARHSNQIGSKSQYSNLQFPTQH